VNDRLRLGWRTAAGLPPHNGRYRHIFLPQDPHEAYDALVGLSGPRTAARQVLAAGGPEEYDHARLHDLVANEGFSHHPGHGAAPSSGFMASYDAPHGSGQAVVHKIHEIGPEHIAAHRASIGEHLDKPHSYQGGWHDTSSGDVYLDASRHFPAEDEEGCRNFCADNHQKAYFKLDDFSERFMNPKQDPLAMKDEGAWHERYQHVGTEPHARWNEFGHKYPSSREQKEFWSLKGEHTGSKGRMDGRPVGAFRSPAHQRRMMNEE
jgi:hypothetical protein